MNGSAQGRLEITVPGLDPYEVLLLPGVNKVGRAIDNTIGLRDMNVSRYHFHIEVRQDGCYLKDLGSRNGTRVNNTHVPMKRLEDRDVINVGGTTLVFRSSVASQALQPSAVPLSESTDGIGQATVKSDIATLSKDPAFAEALKYAPFNEDENPQMNISSVANPFAAPIPDPVAADPFASPLGATTPQLKIPTPAMPAPAIVNTSPPTGRVSADNVPAQTFEVPPPRKREGAPKRKETGRPNQKRMRVSTRLKRNKSSLFDGNQAFEEGADFKKRWARMSEVAAILGSEHDLNTLLVSIVDAVLQLVPSRGAFLVLVDTEGEFRLEIARNVEAEAIQQQEGRYRLSTQICRQAVTERKPILTESAHSDGELGAYRSVASLRIESVLCLPFGVRDQVLGVVYLDNPSMKALGDDEDELLEIVEAFGNLAGLAVWNAQLLENARHQERIDQELRIAAQIQRSLLPRQAPVLPGYELDGRSSPAREIGGDLYDFVIREQFNDLLIAIGDVSGKGVGAGLVGSSTRSLVRAYSTVHQQTDRILVDVNRQLSETLEPGFFVSFLLIRVDLKTGECFYTGAGHEHLIIYRHQTRHCEKLQSGGTVLGLTPDISSRLKELPLTLNLGDGVVLYTDGATEATNAQGEEFGINRVGQIVLRCGEQTPADIVHAIFETVMHFHGRDNEQEDDLTIVAFRRSVQ